MRWLMRAMAANLTNNMNNNARKARGRVSQPPRSKSSNAAPSQPMTRTLKSQSTPVIKNENLVDSMRSMSVSRNRVRSAVRIPIRTNSSSSSQLETMEDICYYMQSNKVKNVVVMAGAGISTSSGIPDFRTPGTGLYDNLRQYKIPYPEAIFDIDYFHYNPRPFFTLAKELYPSGAYQPNVVHYFCRLLYDRGMLLRMYTQNIDGLERIVGIPPNKLVEAHGTFSSATCVKCRRKYDGEEIKEEILSGKLPHCRSTLSCSGIIKPDIVFFGEELPRRFWYYLKDFPQADMLIVMGTSLEVEPFAGIVDYTRFPVPRVLFNLKAVGPFKKRRRMNDVAIRGDLVQNISQFMKRLGWSQDFYTVSGQPLPAESSTESDSESKTESDNRGNETKIENETSTDKDDSKNASGDGPKKKVEIVLPSPLRRNETPLQDKRNQNGVTNTNSETNVRQIPNSSPQRKLHTLSANPSRLLTKRGSTGSLLPQKAHFATRTVQRPSLPKLTDVKKRVNAYKETLDKLRRWHMDTSSSGSSESNDESDSSDD